MRAKPQEAWKALDFTEEEVPESRRFRLRPGQVCEYHSLDACTRAADAWPWTD